MCRGVGEVSSLGYCVWLSMAKTLDACRGWQVKLERNATARDCFQGDREQASLPTHETPLLIFS